MNCKLADSLYDVGALDWEIRDFHGVYTPQGSKYNSFLLLDEKIAIIDSVKECFGKETICKIKEIIKERDVDYLVSLHTEPDHAGSITEYFKEFKNIKLVCLEKNYEFIKNFLPDLDGSRVLVLKSGESLSLGEKTLVLKSLPMTHWPDTTSAYIPEKGWLFTSDFFGSLISISRPFYDQLQSDIYPFIRDYFAFLMRPFESLTKKALDYYKSLNPTMILPAHGPFYRRPEDIKYIFDVTEKLINDPTENKVIVVYTTMWHTTEKMAKLISEGAGCKNDCEVKVFDLREDPVSVIMGEIMTCKAFAIGSPTVYNGVFPNILPLLRLMRLLRLKGKRAVIFGSFGWSGGAVKEIEDAIKPLGVEVIEKIETRFSLKPEEIKKCLEVGKMLAEL
ncbi:flavodoxin/nitric oxide synthase [Thermodesulfobium narugense DSM 14796]|uniref:Flavodoxin/nitric oxide synthase n=1 Tax=Thermodesulfobium narugense DSM 14796 TaxID=747365 RepID=M1E8U8_9BACT|nr:FprA family A-type flavoprotein [Thermodesulfobium narugense]AEE15368.1 flavodoxin/nitric oxide synthase [Thermodesulfobium narugense DSM 14796]